MTAISRRCQRGILIASCITSCLLAVSTPTSAQSPPKPKVFIAATGGTIAGVQKSVEQHGYTAGELGIEALVNAVPQLKDLADVRGEQVVNIPSQDMTDAVWLKLARRLQELEQSPDVTSIVVTHGTDTLEETSFFIEATVDTPKPIVFTGSMRPATAISADGPLNLCNHAPRRSSARQRWSHPNKTSLDRIIDLHQ